MYSENELKHKTEVAAAVGVVLGATLTLVLGFALAWQLNDPPPMPCQEDEVLVWTDARVTAHCENIEQFVSTRATR
jgi:hypothetical protein